MISRMITNLREGEVIIIENCVRLYRPSGDRSRLTFAIEAPIEIKIEKRNIADANTQDAGECTAGRRPKP